MIMLVIIGMSIQYREATKVTRCMCEGKSLQVTTTGEWKQLCCSFGVFI